MYLFEVHFKIENLQQLVDQEQVIDYLLITNPEVPHKVGVDYVHDLTAPFVGCGKCAVRAGAV